MKRSAPHSRPDATLRALEEQLGMELRELLFQVPKDRGGSTGGHLYQAWHDRSHMQQGSRIPIVIRIEHTLYLMFKLGMGAEIVRQVRTWNAIYAPDPIRHKSQRIILEEAHASTSKARKATQRIETYLAAATSDASDATITIHNAIAVQLNTDAGDPAPDQYRRSTDRVYIDDPTINGTSTTAPDADAASNPPTNRSE